MATNPQGQRSCDLKAGDAGLLQNPYFPEKTLWPLKSGIGWYVLSNINGHRRTARNEGLVAMDESAEAASKAWVVQALQAREEREARKEEKNGKKRPAEEQRETRKKARVAPAKVRNEVPPSTSTTPQVDWAAFYGRPARNNTRTAATKQLHDQADTIVRLETENARLEVENRCLQAETARLEGETARLVREAQLLVHENEAIPGEHERLPFHPEFREFMRETFAREAMVTCNAQRIDAEAAAAKGKFFILGRGVLRGHSTHPCSLGNFQRKPKSPSSSLRCGLRAAEQRAGRMHRQRRGLQCSLSSIRVVRRRSRMRRTRTASSA
ncbi:hypothetical protein C8R43DRAFT_217312 [Mycena crocata]|nr:hypothetical protein C8R43DRAFT_217312 [Mycena crocata]